MSVPVRSGCVSPHLLVAQAVTAALRSVGVPAETRRWESVLDDDGSPGARGVTTSSGRGHRRRG